MAGSRLRDLVSRGRGSRLVMTITVGADTYVSVADADTYVGLNFISTDPKRVAWDLLSDGDKEILLRRATQSIEAIKYPGLKFETSQTLSFPRQNLPQWPIRRELDYCNWWFDSFGTICPFSSLWTATGDVPDAIKNAEIEEALESASPGIGSSIKKRKQKGVTSVKIGNFSENFQPGATNISNMASVFGSIKAQEFIAQFQNGGFRIV